MNTYLPSPRASYSPTATERATLTQFVLLSMLLHALFIALFGNTGGTGERRSGVFWGQLEVSMPRLSAQRDSEVKLEPGAGMSSAAAALQHLRSTAPAAAVPLPQIERPVAARETSLAPPPPPPPAAALPSIDLSAPQVVNKPLMPFVVTPPLSEPVPVAKPFSKPMPREEALLPMLAPEQAPIKVERDVVAPPLTPPLAPPPEPPTVAAPPIPPALPEPSTAPTFERNLAPPVELKPRELPAPTEASPLIQTSSPEAPVPPKIERELVAPAQPQTRDAPIVPTPSSEVVTAPKVERELLAPSEPKASATPIVPSASDERSAAPLRELAPPASATPRLPAGTPNLGEEIFKARRDGVTPPPATGNTPPLNAPKLDAPRLDLDAVRKRAREMASEGSGRRAILPFPLPPKPEHKTKEAIAFDKALKRPDCKDAYAGMGLLAVAPLLWSAIGDEGCRW